MYRASRLRRAWLREGGAAAERREPAPLQRRTGEEGERGEGGGAHRSTPPSREHSCSLSSDGSMSRRLRAARAHQRPAHAIVTPGRTVKLPRTASCRLEGPAGSTRARRRAALPPLTLGAVRAAPHRTQIDQGATPRPTRSALGLADAQCAAGVAWRPSRRAARIRACTCLCAARHLTRPVAGLRPRPRCPNSCKIPPTHTRTCRRGRRTCSGPAPPCPARCPAAQKNCGAPATGASTSSGGDVAAAPRRRLRRRGAAAWPQLTQRCPGPAPALERQPGLQVGAAPSPDVGDVHAHLHAQRAAAAAPSSRAGVQEAHVHGVVHVGAAHRVDAAATHTRHVWFAKQCSTTRSRAPGGLLRPSTPTRALAMPREGVPTPAASPADEVLGPGEVAPRRPLRLGGPPAAGLPVGHGRQLPQRAVAKGLRAGGAATQQRSSSSHEPECWYHP